MNRLDKEKLDFHEKVKDGYDKVNHMYPERIQVINANHSIEDVFQQVYLFFISIIDYFLYLLKHQSFFFFFF